MNATVLVVDDEERIRSSLCGILGDEGFRVVATGDAPQVLDLVEQEKPEVVLLDVWMPELDGIELLRRIKHANPRTHVIMISGHANIQNAVAATRLGAADFIEKPFSVGNLLAALQQVLGRDIGDAWRAAQVPGHKERVHRSMSSAPRTAIPQRTISRSLVLGGQGLHSGLKTGVILHPAPAGSGITFSSLAAQSAIPARLESVSETGYNTTLSGRGHSVRTVEHLLSALHGLAITNLRIQADNEVPALDGSALEFCKQLMAAGIEDQDDWIEPIAPARPIQVGEGGESISIEPAERLLIDYTLDYPLPIGLQQVHFELSSPDAYVKEIAPARTFGLVREFRKMTELGLAKGGRLDNCILIDDEKIVNTTLRFVDEFARHKVLDLMGDLYLLGRPINGHVVAV
ncbi:MAG: UDP-3-O-[3-hydroxymyristoyl] N-acetylglucosamine deacetylase, partial [Deltaproteobacteria bacterium]|nr:UDP-3-O-[3-hydroxymyristoyl] N-acetylglucosamine deacetylase [Deltaproteobacteria bacterium]